MKVFVNAVANTAIMVGATAGYAIGEVLTSVKGSVDSIETCEWCNKYGHMNKNEALAIGKKNSEEIKRVVVDLLDFSDVAKDDVKTEAK